MSSIDPRLVDIDAERRLLGAGVASAADWTKVRSIVAPDDFGLRQHALVAEALDQLGDVGPFYAGWPWERYEAVAAALGGREPPSSHHVRAAAIDAYLSVHGPAVAPAKVMRRLVWLADGRWEADARVVKGLAVMRAEVEALRAAEAALLADPGTAWTA